MEPVKELDYGTVAEPVVLQERSKSKTVVAVVGGLLCVAVLAMSFGTSSTEVAAVVNSNAGTDDLTGALMSSVCEDDNMRYAIATFNEDNNEIVRCQSATATDHWETDFDDFQDALASCAELNTMGIAFAVYNMPIWEDTFQSKYNVFSTFVRYESKKLDLSERAYAATFLGAILVDAQCAAGAFNIEVEPKFGYKDACGQLKVNTEQCKSVEDVHCPFNFDWDNQENPCKTEVCRTSVAGGTFDSGDYGFGHGCCDAISSWCDGTGNGESGCGDFQMKHIYRDHCDEDYEGQTEGEVFYYHPKLVEMHEEADEEVVEATTDTKSAGDVDKAITEEATPAAPAAATSQ